MARVVWHFLSAPPTSLVPTCNYCLKQKKKKKRKPYDHGYIVSFIKLKGGTLNVCRDIMKKIAEIVVCVSLARAANFLANAKPGI